MRSERPWNRTRGGNHDGRSCGGLGRDEGIKRAVKKILWIAIPAALIAGLILLVQQRQGGGATHEAQQELMGTIVAVIDLSLAVSRQTGGAFDISFKPLGDLHCTSHPENDDPKVVPQ